MNNIIKKDVLKYLERINLIEIDDNNNINDIIMIYLLPILCNKYHHNIST